MKGFLIGIGILIFFAVCIGGCGIGAYNGFVAKDQNVQSAWAQVQNQYQRRMDLIPNLVEVVKGYATHESKTFTDVAEARAGVGKLVVTPDVLKDPAAFKKFQQAQGELSSVLSRLMAVSESYPQLKANENFLQLQSQLEGTENRISVERKRFNETVQDYNTSIRTFPGSVIASMTGFTSKPYFEAEEGANKAPKIKF